MSDNQLSRYELLEEVGRGNMGVVYKARDPAIDRIVAVKVVRLGFSLDDVQRRTFLERFRREAKISGKLTHPHIAGVYDIGWSDDEDEPFLVMEYFEGISLSQLLARGTPEVEEVRQMTRQLASALAYAHAEGVVHRDIKPANVLYQPGPTIKLVDFGIAKIEALELTATGEFIGTPGYMSPEIFAGDAVDGRSDLFSLGVILYQSLTGQKPFEADSVSRTIYRVLHEEPKPPSRLREGLSEQWDFLCARLLAKNPADRYASAESLISDLDAIGRGEMLATMIYDEPTQPIRTPVWTRLRLGLAAAALIALVLAFAGSSIRPMTAEAPVVDPPSPIDALATDAERALEEGRIDESASLLNAIRAHDPDNPRNEELAENLELARLSESLPLRFVARHEHRVGHCTGDLALGLDGVRFDTTRHGRWQFRSSRIRELRRVNGESLLLRPSRGEPVVFTFLRPELGADVFEGYVEVLAMARRAEARADE